MLNTQEKIKSGELSYQLDLYWFNANPVLELPSKAHLFLLR